MKLVTMLATTAILTGAVALTTSAAPAAAEDMARGVSSCSQLRLQHPEGIAKNKKAAKRAVKQGYQRPFVCKHVYLKLKALDRNRNKSVCEVR